MTLEQRVEFFRTSTLLAELDGAQLSRLAEACRESFPEAGQVVAREGETGNHVHWVVEGQFEVFVEQAELALLHEIRKVERGAHFGEVALLTGTPRTASVRAATKGHLLELDRETLLECIQTETALLAVFLKQIGWYLAEATQDQARVPLVRLDAYPGWAKHGRVLPGKISEACRAVVLAVGGNEVTVGMPDPYDLAARNFLVQVLHPRRPRFVALMAEDFARATREDSTLKVGEPDPDCPEIVVSGADGASEVLGEEGADADLRWVFQMVQDTGATDIHFDPFEGGMLVKLRIQGNMVTLDRTVPRAESLRIVSRLKVISGLDITERRRPHDGSFVVTINHHRRCVRLSIIPSYWGEKAALRLLADDDDQLTLLETLVPSRAVAAAIRALFSYPSGLVLVCGPTGAGKTTLLYSGLRTILERSPVRNIITIEEPVDRLLHQVTQIPVNRRVGFGFPEALRAALRQDPDVLLVGEIRDRETALVALEAAATGHLVLSSVHAHFAPGSVTRLRSLEAEPYLIESSLRGVVALRLVPRNCPACSEPLDADDSAMVEFRRIVPGGSGGGDSGARRGRGCAACRQRGTLGRMAVVEVLAPDRATLSLLAAGEPMPEAVSGWLPMSAYAGFLVGQGWVAPENLLGIFTGVDHGLSSSLKI